MPTGSPLLSFGSVWHLPEYKSQASKSSACGRFSDLGLWAQIGPSEHGGSRQVGGRLGPLVVTVRPVGTLLWQPSRVKHSSGSFASRTWWPEGLADGGFQHLAMPG